VKTRASRVLAGINEDDGIELDAAKSTIDFVMTTNLARRRLTA
jgi:hypothetical protein